MCASAFSLLVGAGIAFVMTEHRNTDVDLVAVSQVTEESVEGMREDVLLNEQEVEQTEEGSQSVVDVDSDAESGELATSSPDMVTTVVQPSIQDDAPSTEHVSLSYVWRPIADDECGVYASSSIFYYDPQSVLVRKERELRSAQDSKSADYLREISCFPYATWLTWSDATATKNRVDAIVSQAELQGKIPVFVTYQNPGHSKAEWYSGLAGEAYLNWNRAVADAIGTRSAWVILEPDALGLSFSYSPSEQEKRLNELSSVIDIFNERAPNTRIYLDAGHSEWLSPEQFASLLFRAGVKKADGFATNISNYESLEKELIQNMKISNILGGTHFLIDTSRNGIGGTDDREWCNAPGRALGVRPTVDTGNPYADAYLWIKVPGESDGTCGGGPSAGAFWLEYAIGLVRTALSIR